MEKKGTVSEATPVEGEFISDNNIDQGQENDLVDLSEFNQNEFRSYQIKKGDSLLLISFKVYRDYRKWWVFKHFNPDLNENILIPGGT